MTPVELGRALPEGGKSLGQAVELHGEQLVHALARLGRRRGLASSVGTFEVVLTFEGTTPETGNTVQV